MKEKVLLSSCLDHINDLKRQSLVDFFFFFKWFFFKSLTFLKAKNFKQKANSCIKRFSTQKPCLGVTPVTHITSGPAQPISHGVTPFSPLCRVCDCDPLDDSQRKAPGISNPHVPWGGSFRATRPPAPLPPV